MKVRITLITLVAALTACGGNYSNEDLEYLNALPTRSQLQTEVPGAATTTGALSQRRDPLAVGERSKTYVDTRRTSEEFNRLLDFFLGILEEVRKTSPTSREDNRRVWGPFPDRKNPGFSVQVVMLRADDQHFDWFIEFRETTAAKDAPWLIGMSGKFLASSGVRKGRGEMHLFLKELRARKLTDASDDGKLNTVDVTYVTDSPPISVDLTLTGVDGNLTYSFREYEPGRATLWFTVDSPSTGGLDAHEVFNVRSGWNVDGAGRATISYENKTTGATANGAECWDTSFNVVYFSRPWETPSAGGDPAACVTVEGIQ